MCGIVYVRRSDKISATKVMLKRFENQRSRGTSGFGFITLRNNKIHRFERREDEDQIKKLLSSETSSEILFHHRLPTSTPNISESAHPIPVKNNLLKYDYYVVHNGIISNADELKDRHTRLGFKYSTEIKKKWITQKNSVYSSTCFNDSEALAIELALLLDGKKKKIDAEGSIAFIALQTNKEGKALKLFFGRNSGNPLHLEIQKSFFSLSSESKGGASNIKSDRLYSYDYKKNKVSNSKLEIGKYNTNYYAPGYSYFGDDDEDEFNYHTDFEDFEDYEDMLCKKQDLKDRLKIAQIESDFDAEQEVSERLGKINATIFDYEKENPEVRDIYD